eukprot:11855167-Alexandrium_andersonii.AAC.1
MASCGQRVLLLGLAGAMQRGRAIQSASPLLRLLFSSLPPLAVRPFPGPRAPDGLATAQLLSPH